VAAIGVDAVLVTCDEENPASARAIEREGGVLEDTRPGPGGRPTRRYWIA
jgi:predicted acetyltransferase